METINKKTYKFWDEYLTSMGFKYSPGISDVFGWNTYSFGDFMVSFILDRPAVHNSIVFQYKRLKIKRLLNYSDPFSFTCIIKAMANPTEWPLCTDIEWARPLLDKVFRELVW
jgi:hypothetical protein